MKFIFSLLFVYSISIQSRDIILIEYQDSSDIELLKSAFKRNNIPEDLSVFRKVNVCKKDSNPIIHLCFDKKNDFRIMNVKSKAFQSLMETYNEIDQI